MLGFQHMMKIISVDLGQDVVFIIKAESFIQLMVV